ncbi:hypothetical protein M8369_25255, partial [Klebsiella pneumoniae]|nr:hypothetical protein [Klebsiella pneumoniae]
GNDALVTKKGLNMNAVCTLDDSEFLAELEKDLAESIAQFDKHFAEIEVENERFLASLAAEPLLEIEPLDIDFDW